MWLRAGALALLLAGCAVARPPALGPKVFRAPETPDAGERYSAWFADERDGVLYFGLSVFWTALWASGDPSADLRVPGPHLIGRFDLASESFLPPLLARAAGPDVRSSVWDVLAHPNGWVYYTTFYEAMGRVRPETAEVEYFPALGRGLNELALGPGGEIYLTRYGSGVDDPRLAGDGSVLVITESGEKLREASLHARDGAVTAVKSVAVDPRSGQVHVNADVLRDGTEVEFASFVLDADLAVLQVTSGDPELLFVAFARDGRRYAIEDHGGRLRLELRGGGRESVSIDLGARVPADFAQDIHFAPDGTAAIAFWSGRVELVREREGRVEQARVVLDKPGDCGPPAGRSLLYSAFSTERAVYATLYCGETILRGPLPEAWQPAEAAP